MQSITSRKIIQLLLLLFFTSTILSACGGGGDKDEPLIDTVISGRILDAATSQPVSFAQIWTNPPSSTTTTNEQGQFSITNGVTADSQQYSVYASASGYASNNTVVTANSTGFSSADIQLNRGKTGLATDPDTLRFSNTETSKTFYLTTDLNNSNFSIESTEAWLSATPISGTIVNAGGERKIITVTVNRTNLADGNHTAELAINSSNVIGTTLSVIAAVNADLPIIVDPPTITAIDDVATVNAGSSVAINPLANDEGASLQVVSNTTPTQGTLSKAGSSFTYTANADATGTDSFTYTVGDSNGKTALATILININSTIPEILAEKVAEEFKIVLKECHPVGSDLDCSLSITREGAPTNLWLECGFFGSRLIDSNGSEYASNRAELGNSVESGDTCGRSKFEFSVSGLTALGAIRYKNVPSNMTNPQLIEIDFIHGSLRSTGTEFSVQFTGVSLTP